MNHRLKQRLIGGAILVALGVVFLPMLLDGTGWRERNSELLEIPPEPEFVMPERPGAVRRPVAIPGPVREANAPDPVAGTERPSAEQAVPKGSEPAGEPSPEREAEEPPPKPVAVAGAGGDERRVPPASQASATASKGWSVQVGAFEKKSGAEKLAARLRLRGYPVFVRRTEVGSKSLYRVKVGPLETRSEARAIQQRLERQERLSGLVQRER